MDWYVTALRSGVPFPSGETAGRGTDEGWPTSLGGEFSQPAFHGPFNLRKKRKPRKGKPAISKV